MKEEKISLTDLQDLLNNKSKYFVNTTKGHTGISNTYGEGDQGEYNETYKFYKHPKLPESVFMRETYRTDSYGSNDSLYEITFVTGKSKTITIYEAI